MEWDPTQFFRTGEPQPAPFALLVLNQPINEKAFRVLKQHAPFTICADGGANRFYDLMKKQNDGSESTTLPDAIVGDLDSIHTSVRSHYENLGVTVVEDGDQYSTDFTKCLKYLKGHAGEILSPITKPSASAWAKQNDDDDDDTNRLDILILGGLGGRVDQAFSQIHHLYQMTREYSSAESAGGLYLVSEESLTFILQPGTNVIHTPGVGGPQPEHNESTLSSDGNAPDDGNAGEGLLEENVGIIPLSGPARITTKGFEWDVEDWHTEIGGQISTSNHIRADVVKVQTDVPVLFTVELAGRFKRVR